jgi:predicted Zn-ribbon and HTH transcriptional regulator
MTCHNEDCGKVAIILVDPEEVKVPNICPFCGSESSEDSQD